MFLLSEEELLARMLLTNATKACSLAKLLTPHTLWDLHQQEPVIQSIAHL